MTKLTTPSVLAFESKLACSDAVMLSGNWQDRTVKSGWTAIQVTEKSVRGTISNRLKGAKASKIDAEVEKANLQTVDNAALPFNSDTLKVTFTLRVLGNLAVPSTCNNPEYQSELANKIAAYVQENGFKELAKRYATNLANGRFLWRNRVGAEQIEVRINHGEQQWIFDAQELGLTSFDHNNDKLEQISSVIELGLLGEKATLLTVEAYVQLGEAQTVFPSQELVMNSGDKKSKILFQLSGQAAMHSQKIGNALRTIDTWYPQSNEFGPIAIEPYGSVTNRGIAYRKPKEKNDFYNILDSWMLKDKTPSLNEQHYLMAMLVRGGVFGE
ncbi:type I-F CRISPR-associated protein Csy3 [Vibrio mediterranei]|jgi:CRISPR-associated protein Csy3|uniref:type I-F CRISPR-associated protein Csy3 n=1 Tax=Vibrio TaxID=662 RepID=UPI0004DCF243|nr:MULTISPECIES: type I-F CRISPR-associated protein Csy3 [Vibrio]KFA99429.1 CRISPR-associated protein Cas5 [Vibrio sp. ER1A]MCG9627717.1 type I-F CRISPR-associated protein Csy3 [Vibrio mediterranei]